MPRVAGQPTPSAARYSFPAPPAPATAPPGRPPTPAPAPTGSRAAMAGGSAAPQPGSVPAPGVGTATPPPVAAPSPSATPGSPQPASGAGSSTTRGTGPAAPAAPGQPTVDQNGAATQTMPTSPNIPAPGSLVPGASVATPYGVASTDPVTGKQTLALDAAGQQKYKESVAALRAKFTLPSVMKGMTGLPQMELRLGASNFDPFTGRFHGKE